MYLFIYFKGFIWNPSNCECECDKSCDIGENLNYEYCKCRKKLVDKLTECNSVECNMQFRWRVYWKYWWSKNCWRKWVRMFLHNLCCFGSNSLSNQHWNWCLFCLFLLVLEKILLVLSLVPVLNENALKQQFNELIKMKNQTNRDNLLFLQGHN